MKQSQIFQDHYEPFLKSGLSIKVYCQQYDLDYHRFRKWRITHEQINNLPITYRPRDKKSAIGIAPLQIIRDSVSTHADVAHLKLRVNLKLPHGIDVNVENITPRDLLFLIRSL